MKDIIFTAAILLGIIFVLAVAEILLGKLFDFGASKRAKEEKKEKPDFFQSLRPRNAILFVLLWNAPIIISLGVYGFDLPERILDRLIVVQSSLLGLAGISVLLSRKLQRWIFREGITLNQVREGYFAIFLWIGLGTLFFILYRL